MSNINRNIHFPIDLKLSGKNYHDIQLSGLNKDCGCYDDPITPISCISFTGTTINYGTYVWENYVEEGEIINQFGITGYDTRYVSTIDSDLTLPIGNPLGSLVLKAVDGENFCYNIFSGDTIDDPASLCGGFFQGFYKLDGHDYQVLPEFYEKGWTMEFHIMKQSACTECDTLSLLNEEYPNNEGIFFYWGTRAENKFCSINEDNLAYEVQSGVTFLESIIQDNSHIIPEGNPFLYFTCANMANYVQSGTTIELPDCCDDLYYNALAFRITPDNRVGYRYLGSSGTCVDGKFEDEFAVFEEYSTFTGITNDTLHLITIKFENYKYLDCKPKQLKYGILSIYVDGYLKLRKYDFPNIIPYKFDDLSSKQLGVPFNISIGGGTQGLLEANQYEPQTYSVCDYKFYLKKNQVFQGIILSGVTITSEDLIYTESDEIVEFLETNIPNRFGVITAIEYTNYTEFNLKLVYDDFSEVLFETVGFVNINDDNNCCCPNDGDNLGTKRPIKSNCFTFTTSSNSCGILEENFAGSFIGKIKSFCLYSEPLTLEQIRCNKNEIYI